MQLMQTWDTKECTRCRSWSRDTWAKYRRGREEIDGVKTKAKHRWARSKDNRVLANWQWQWDRWQHPRNNKKWFTVENDKLLGKVCCHRGDEPERWTDNKWDRQEQELWNGFRHNNGADEEGEQSPVSTRTSESHTGGSATDSKIWMRWGTSCESWSR